MSFLQPLFFWASALIIPLAAIYFLKVRPRRDTTTAIFLWQKIYQQKQASSLLNRLRDLLSLLLLILAFMLLTFAMAKPHFVSEDGNDLLILIDNSASMAAKSKTDSKTRLQQACKQARDIVTGLGAGKRAAIATVADQIDYKSYLSDNSKQLVRAINEIEQTEIAFNIEALEKASGSLGSQKSSRVILISDAAAFTVDTIVNGETLSLIEQDKSSDDPNSTDKPAIDDKTKKPDRQLPGGIELVKIGSEAENVGIVSCDLQEVVTENGKMSFYCRLANSGEKTIEADLLLYHMDKDESAEQLRRLEQGQFDKVPGRLIKAMPATITPGLNDPMFFHLADNLPGRYIVLLDHSDATAADNVAYLTIGDRDPIRIGVLNQDRFFFEHSIQAFSQSTGLIELKRLSTTDGDDATEIFLAEGNITPEQIAGYETSSGKRKFAAIIFNPAGESDCWTLTENTLNADEIVPKLIDKDHPAIRYYDPTVIPFYGAKELILPPEGQVILETDTGVALIWRVNSPDKDIIVVNIDPSQGEFYYSPFFPVMVYRMALTLAGREKIAVSTCSTNDSLPEHIRKTADPIAMTTPLSYTTESLQPQNLPALTTAGFYTLNQRNQATDISCSLLNTKETLLNDSILKSDAGPIRKGHSPSYWLTLLALAIVATESILYHRRKVG
ncbi:MAG: VWA domain-containing protein [Planctomycetes bacterium]|nr:VWA domain-containing protein [Planctomycetota bacterium]